jgi:hypothetical protein
MWETAGNPLTLHCMLGGDIKTRLSNKTQDKAQSVVLAATAAAFSIKLQDFYSLWALGPYVVVLLRRLPPDGRTQREGGKIGFLPVRGKACWFRMTAGLKITLEASLRRHPLPLILAGAFVLCKADTRRTFFNPDRTPQQYCGIPHPLASCGTVS